MSLTKQVRLVALFLVVVAVFSPTPALAAGAIKLLPTDVEPSASGEVKWGRARAVAYNSNYGVLYNAPVRVTCKGLTPGNAYYPYRVSFPGWFWLLADPVIADETGAVSWEDTFSYVDVRPSFEVWNQANKVVLRQ